ncbi:extracellular solute-binding protein [Buchananella hordeovulneris]|uniref:Extracellular solute-binding protein n=2 Tax=Buchananella hordeovulneris TaxID=52770 RepID=A0A1Q5PU74_9ACTO|nr:extracellular solute-binding protein [Buchananella hordeovulneris]OKL50930.1 hypothetical protein BSZ40_09845 [Buchananella hordeovulneris]
MKRGKQLTALAAGLALTLTACGTDTESKDAQPTGGEAPAASADLNTTIKILAPSYSESSKSDWETIIKKFNETYPNVKVELQIEGWEDFAAKVQARIQSGDLPDILNDNTFALAASEGLLYPITEVMSPETLAAIEPALLENGKGTDGTQWAAPDVASSRLLAYNTKLFEQAGITEAPKTWAELEAAAQKIKGLGGDVSAYGMPLGKEEAQNETSLWLWGNGANWPQGDKLVADQPAAAEALTQMKSFIDAGLTQPNPGTSNRQDAVNLFNNGKLAMLLMHTGLLKEVDEKYPDIKYGIGPVPTKDGQPIAFGVTDFVVAFDNGDADRKAATKAFLDLMYSDEMYESWYQGTGLMPVTKTMIEKATAEAGHFAPFYAALKDVKFLPVGDPKWDALQGALQGTMGKLEKETPDTVLKEIQAQLDAQG